MIHFAHQSGGAGELSELGHDESLALLATGRVGRLAFTRRALPDIVPVKFVLHEEDLLIQLDPASTVAQAVRGAVVAFEVDDLDPAGRGSWSVTVVGSAQVVQPYDADGLSGPDVGMDGNPTLVLRIGTEFISGHRVDPQLPAPRSDPVGV
jgi:hypothetical protein